MTLFGISILVRLLQPENAALPILVTLLDINIFVTFLKLLNWQTPISVIVSGITISVTSSYSLFSSNI